MSEKQETIPDIMAEMRGFKRYAASDSGDCRYVAYWLYQTFSDRIEAAHKREMDKLQQQYDECARDYNDAQRARSAANSEIAELKKQIGNCAKMREALEFADKELRNATEDDRLGDDLVYLVGCMRTVAEVCHAALAAPPRNCDVGTAEEQNRRYELFCIEHRTYENCCGDCPCKEVTSCELGWAQMPYGEGGVK